MVQAAAVAAEIDKREAELLQDFCGNSGPGRPDVLGSRERAAGRLGVNRETLRLAEQHVAAVEKYPEVKDEPQSVAVTYAKAVDERPELRALNATPRGIARA